MAKLTVEFNDAMTRLLTDLADRMRISRVDVLKRSLAVYAALENSTPEQGATVSFARVGGELAIPGFTWDWRRDETHA